MHDNQINSHTKIQFTIKWSPNIQAFTWPQLLNVGSFGKITRPIVSPQTIRTYLSLFITPVNSQNVSEVKVANLY